jgi:clan AA aspartic protease (TIGR02281 family)
MRLHSHRFTISHHSHRPFLPRSMATQNTSNHLCSSMLVWLSLVALLFGNLVLTGVSRPSTWYDCGNAQGRDDHSDIPPQVQAPQLSQPSEVQLAAVELGRRGVTEEPGRRHVTEQPSRPGADSDQATRKPTSPVGRLRPIIVEAILNRQVSVPLMLDTGATYTVLTRQTAHDLGIMGLERLPKQSFLTPGGPILAPVTTLKSVRVGTAEAQDVAAAIDVEGHLPLGLLGMTFMRYFKVTMDQVQGQVKFEPR